MKFGIILICGLLQSVALSAQNVAANMPAKFDVVVSFGSICCGTASDDFLKDCIKMYTSKTKDSIIALKVDGCGREGEYKILFSLVKWEESKKMKFISALKKMIPEQNKKNKATNASSGPISLDYDVALSEFSYCIGQPTKWKWEK